MKPPESLAAQALVRIFAQEMTLAPEQVFLRDQNFKQPNDKRLYLSIGLMSAQVISNVTDMIDIPLGTATQTVQRSKVVQREDVIVDVYSAGTEALFRHWEVVAALQSFFSQQVQESKQFKVFRIPRQFFNTSGAEGGSIINRYSIVIGCHVWYEKRKPLTNAGGGDYFDDFKTRVDDEQTIGTDTPLIAFEINEKGIVP